MDVTQSERRGWSPGNCRYSSRPLAHTHAAIRSFPEKRMLLATDFALRQGSLDVFSDGLFSCNPSIVETDRGYIALVQGVNYDREAIYYKCDWQAVDRRCRLSSKHKFVYMDHDFSIVAIFDLDTSAIVVDPPHTVSIEDLRLFYLGTKMMVMGTHIKRKEVLVGPRWIVADQTYRIFTAAIEVNQLTDVKLFDSPANVQLEKNWMPCVSSEVELSLITNINTGARINIRISEQKMVASRYGNANDFLWEGGWSGSSCLVPYCGGYIGIVHRATVRPPLEYRHMYILTDRSLKIVKRSTPFSFGGFPIEFCCGLVVNEGDNVAVISYSTFDKTANFIKMSLSDIALILTVDVNEQNPINDIVFDHTIDLSAALKCLAGHEEQIWQLMDELVAAQSRTDMLANKVSRVSPQTDVTPTIAISPI